MHGDAAQLVAAWEAKLKREEVETVQQKRGHQRYEQEAFHRLVSVPDNCTRGYEARLAVSSEP